MKKLATLLVTSALAFAGPAMLVTGCGGSSGGNTPDTGAPDSHHMMEGGAPDVHHHPEGGPSEGGKEGGEGGPSCQTLPQFVDTLIKTKTDNTSSPVAIPTCAQWPQLTPTGTAPVTTTDPQSATEFSPLP